MKILSLLLACLILMSTALEASMERGYSQSSFCLDIEVRDGKTGETRFQIAKHYPGQFESYTNCSFIRRKVYAPKHHRKASGWGAVGFHIYKGKVDTTCPSGHRRGVVVQSAWVKIGYWDSIKNSLPQAVNPETGKEEPYALCAAEGNLLMKNGSFIKDNQGFDNRGLRCRRPVIAIKQNDKLYQGYMYGSSYEVFRQLKKAGFVDAIALDSDSTTAPNALVFDIIGITKKKSARYQDYAVELEYRKGLRQHRKQNLESTSALTGHIQAILDPRAFTVRGEGSFFWQK